MDFLVAIYYFGWCELLSLPLRGALAGWAATGDVRRTLSRVAGPALLVLPLWAAAHVLDGALSTSAGWAWLTLALLVAVAAWGRHHGLGRFLGYDPARPLARHLAFDAFALFLMLGFVVFRRHVPAMTCNAFDPWAGAEKFTNAMLHWACWEGRTVPPPDLWLAGQPLAYYYWGHFVWAWIGRMSGLAAGPALTLALARLTTLVAEAAWLLARAIGLRPLAAVGGALMAVWSGPLSSFLHTVHVLAAPGPISDFGRWRILWQPSRTIDNVVDEFPAFTAILGDYHAHHLALPWLLGWTALALAGRRWQIDPRNPRPANRAIGWIVFFGLALFAVMGNAWHLPLLALGTLVWLVGRTLADRRTLPANLVQAGLLVGVCWLALHLIRAGSGNPLPTPATEAGFFQRLPLALVPKHLRSDPLQLAAFWGLPAAVLALAAGVRVGRPRRSLGRIAPFGIGTLILLTMVLSPAVPGGAAWAWGGLALVAIPLVRGPRPWLPPRAALLGLACLVVLAGVELVYLKDRFHGSELARYNSYFKLAFPLWVPALLLAWTVGACLWRSCRRPRLLWPLRGLLILMLLAGAIYPIAAGWARLSLEQRRLPRPRPPTLESFDYLEWEGEPWRREAEALTLVRRLVPPGRAVAEAPGEQAYSYAGRLASLAGRPIPLGWAHHEHQWRGVEAALGITDARIRWLDRLYRAPTPGAMRRQAARLQVRWVFFGVREHRRYGPACLDVLRRTATAAWPEEQPMLFELAIPAGGKKIGSP